MNAPASVEVPVPGEDRKRGRHVPLWDFDAPVDDASPLRDSSAGIIAANGMLILAQSLASSTSPNRSSRYVNMALTIVLDTLDFCGAVKLELVKTVDGTIRGKGVSGGCHFDAILRNATANNNERSLKRYSDHGLVYADNYLIEFGNRLLKMGFL